MPSPEARRGAFTVAKFAHGSPAYQEALALRQALLRAPLGLDLYQEDLAVEAGQLHFGLRDARGTLLACVVAVPLGAGRAKIRQMAVATAWQGQGLGRRLLLAVEAELQALGYTHCELHARVSAIGFYEKLGYRAEGPVFEEVTLPHRQMVKAL